MKTKLIIGLAAAGALLAGTAACAGQRDALNPASANLNMAAPVTLQELSTQIGGTVRERRAGEIVQYHAVQDPITMCMRNAGYPAYQPPAWRDSYHGMGAELTLGVTQGRWLAPLQADRIGQLPPAAELKRLEAFNAPEKENPALAALRADQRDSYHAALLGCAPKVSPDRVFPHRFYPLSDKLAALIDQAERDSVGREKATGYSACMADAGFQAADWQNLAETVLADPQRLTREPQAAAADARCRRPVHDAAMRELDELLPGFVSANAAELVALRADWDALVAKAAGFPEGKTHL